MSLEYRIGDVVERLAEIPDGSIDLIVTSPPFLALRSYLPADHPDKHKEIGSEPTPAAFIDTLLGLSAEFARVLAPHGSICIELGDTYAGGGGVVASREHRDEREGTGADGGARVVPIKDGPGWPLAKSLTGIPTLYTWSLAYGRNLLTGQESPAGQWRIRNVIVWARPTRPPAHSATSSGPRRHTSPSPAKGRGGTSTSTPYGRSISVTLSREPTNSEPAGSTPPPGRRCGASRRE
jgi:hypothetical protein